MADVKTGPESPDVLIKNWIGGMETALEGGGPAGDQPNKPNPDTSAGGPAPNNGSDKPAAVATVKPEGQGTTVVPVKPEDKPAAAQPESEKPTDDLPEDKWPRSAVEWKKFKEARKQALQERDTAIASLKSELDTLKKNSTDGPALNPELDNVRKERDELSDRLRTLDVERHPKFKAYFDRKISTQVELAKRIVGPEQAEEAAKLLSMPDGEYKAAQIEEMLLNLKPLQQSRFGSVLNAMAEIEAERQGEISKARENYDQMVAEQKQAQDNKVKAIEKAFNDAALKLQDANVVYQKREGDHEWNKQVEQQLEHARNLFFGKNVTQDQVIRSAFDAAAMPAILAGYEALHAENENLKQQVAELSKAGPALKSSESQSESPAKPVTIRRGSRPDEVIAGWVTGLTTDQ